MARANNGGWDFVKVGGTYQYKEDWFIATVTVLEDNSTDEEYNFKLRIESANETPDGDGTFGVGHEKNPGGYWSGMPQFYEHNEYVFEPVWKRDKQPS